MGGVDLDARESAVDLDGKGNVEELGGIAGGETIIRIYFTNKNYVQYKIRSEIGIYLINDLVWEARVHWRWCCPWRWYIYIYMR